MLPGQIVTHPWLFLRKAVGRIQRRITAVPESPVIKTLHGGVRFELRALPFLDEDDLRAMLTDSYDLILCDNFRQFLRQGDVMVDVGANVGYISAVAASRIGTTGEVHGFEPLQECFARLQALEGLNPQYKFHFHNVALGEQAGSLPISYDPHGGSRNATLVPDHAAPATRSVPVMRLDTYIAQNIAQPERIRLIKIDVEGYEFPVLRGAEQFFANSACRPVIFCELKPWEIRKCRYSLEDLEQYMRRFGYEAYDSVQHGKRIDLRKMEQMDVVLFRV
jgi:FkbM family methyltransferase